MKKRLCLLFAVLFLFSGFAFAEETETADRERSVPHDSAAYLKERDAEMKKWLISYDPSLSDEQADEIIASRAIDPEKPMIALTFDDGPVAGVTDKLLDVLEKNNVRATFFIVGARLKKEENARILPRMLGMGCEIGSHTYNHEKLKNLGKKSATKTIRRVNEHVMELTGYAVKSLRPPGGMSNNNTIKIAGDEGMSVILWSQSCDVHELDPEKICANVYKQGANGRELQPGDIVLLHDTKDRMVTAMEMLIPRLVADGYQLVTVQELLNLSEAGFVPGIQYKNTTDYHGVLKTK